MRRLLLLSLLLASLTLPAQSDVDSTGIAPSEPVDPSKELKVDVQKLVREWLDSIQRTSGTEEAISEIEGLRGELYDSIGVLRDSLREETAEGGGSQVVNQFQDVFKRIWMGLSSTLTRERIIAIVLILLSGVLINIFLRRWVGEKGSLPHRTRLRRLRWYPLLRFSNWFLVIILVSGLLLQHPDVLWPALTALAIGLGLAIKDGLADLLSGLWLIFESPYQIDDRIQVGEHYGEVTRIGIRSTQITTLDDNLVTIPNSVILNDPVANSNAGETHCMAVVRMWLPLNADLEMARATAYEAAITSRYFNFDLGVTILFTDHLAEPPGTILQVKAYVLDAKYEKAFEGDVTETVKRVFVRAGVYGR